MHIHESKFAQSTIDTAFGLICTCIFTFVAVHIVCQISGSAWAFTHVTLDNVNLHLSLRIQIAKKQANN